ncbi:bis(5'-nucleosyl)-tetraphosphatase (symmetrical) YqeK [Candidatus Poribacteria bacterium]|nr:bis(5'-nucleosyl)-tetraphosphatase (symmetrical) YqeK [Candidatus Poribacteria bacterium]
MMKKRKNNPAEKKEVFEHPQAIEIEKYIKKRLERKRYKHVLSVREMALDLAKRYDADRQRVNLAALLHDCAKWMSPPELYEAAAKYGVQLDEVERENASLLHAIVGAELAVALFSVSDPEILSAIRAHTTGNGSMTLIDKIVYVADFAEPKRTHEGASLVRKCAYQELDRAVFEVTRYKIDELLTKGTPIHPKTIDAYNSALRAISKSANQPTQA